MFKKGMRPHNKGNTYVRGNYRNMPKREDRDYDDVKERRIMNRGSNPFRVDINMQDLTRSKNTLRSDRVDLF